MIKITAALITGIACVSFASILIRLADDVPSVVMTAYRLTIASFILIVWSLSKRYKIFPNSKKELLLAALGGLFLSAHFIFWIASIKYTTISSSTTLVATSPIFVGILSYILFREKQSLAIQISILLSIAGSAVLASSDGGIFSKNLNEISLLGDMLAILGAAAVSVYFIIGSKLRKNMKIMQYITLVYSSAAILSTIFVILSGEHFTGYKINSYIYMFLLAIIPQLIGHTSFNWALGHISASAVSIATLGEPIGATILAYIIFSEKVGTIQIAGMLMIFSAIVISAKNSKRNS